MRCTTTHDEESTSDAIALRRRSPTRLTYSDRLMPVISHDFTHARWWRLSMPATNLEERVTRPPGILPSRALVAQLRRVADRYFDAVQPSEEDEPSRATELATPPR